MTTPTVPSSTLLHSIPTSHSLDFYPDCLYQTHNTESFTDPLRYCGCMWTDRYSYVKKDEYTRKHHPPFSTESQMKYLRDGLWRYIRSPKGLFVDDMIYVGEWPFIYHGSFRGEGTSATSKNLESNMSVRHNRICLWDTRGIGKVWVPFQVLQSQSIFLKGLLWRPVITLLDTKESHCPQHQILNW